MWWFRNRFFAPGIIGVLLGSCGFSPLYGTVDRGLSPSDSLAGIAIAPIPDRIGQRLRNHLIDDFAAGSSATRPYRLTVDLDRQTAGFGINADGSFSRQEVRLQAYYRLYETGSSRLIDEGLVRARTSFDVVQSDYNSLAAEADADRLLASEVARRLQTRLAAWFRTHQGDEGP